MATHNQRPRFYEGQYLGADDLASLVDYVRTSDARHALGGHTWGIAAGLHLTEKPVPGEADRVEITLQPGFAWDGFGRLILNPRPLRLREELFARVPYNAALDDVAAVPPKTGRLVPVWLQYDESVSRNPSPGFETCADGDAASRVGELFRFEIGAKTESEQRAAVTIGTTTKDAQKALQAYYSDPANSLPPVQIAPDLWDTSVPHQQFPAGPRPPLWLVPIGYARWIARDQALGYFARRTLDASDNAVDRIRAFRRYIGVVAEYIEAADNAIVLHRRGDRPNRPHRFARLLQARTAQEVLKDLVWVEGNLRVLGDARMAGGRVQFVDADGDDEGTPLYLSRAGDNPAVAAPGQREVRIVIGPAAQATNRLVVGAEQPGPAPGIASTLVAVSSGRVGVGTRDPATSLEVVGDYNGGEGAVRVRGDQPAIRFEPGAVAGGQPWLIHVTDSDPGNLRLAYKPAAGGWKDVLHANPKGTVGVGGSKDPRNPLGVRASGQAQDLVSFEDPGGVTKWHISQKTANGATEGFSLVESGAGAAGEGRLFVQAGGNVGMGTVAPTGRLTISSPNPAQGKLSFFTATTDVEYDGGNDSLFIFTQTGGGITSFMQASVGIGTTTPRAPLGIRANGEFQNVLSCEDVNGVLKWQVLMGAPPGLGLNFRELLGGGAGASRLMLKEGGNVGIGTVNPLEALHVAGSFLRVDGAADTRAYLGGDAAGNDVQVGSMKAGVTNVALWSTASASRMNLFCRDIDCNHIDSATQAIPSDAALKDDVSPIANALDAILRLRGVGFRWKPGVGHGGDDFGVIAQEVAGVLPQIVRASARGLSVSYNSLVPILIEAIKTLKAEVDALRAAVDAKSGEDRRSRP